MEDAKDCKQANGQGAGGSVQLACLSCPRFMHGALLAHLDACLDAIEAAAAAAAVAEALHPTDAAATAEGSDQQSLEQQFDALRAQVDQLAINVIKNARCCRPGDEAQPPQVSAAQTGAAPQSPAPIAPQMPRPAPSVVYSNPYLKPKSPTDAANGIPTKQARLRAV